MNFQITLKSRWLVVTACLATIVCGVFSIFYLFSSRSYLSAWYLRMNDCFYRHEHWRNDFFTADAKKQGNLFCIAALVVCALLLFYMVRLLQKPVKSLKIQFSKWDIFIIVVCILAGTSAWVWGKSLVHQGFDEVFSAVNCADLPAFQTLSYYMLPNNHIFFNMLNGTLFHFAGDKVFTGKLISLVCFWGIIIISYKWLSGIIKNKLVAAAAVMALCFQFPVWGFGFQARGYELYSLTEWLCFLCLVRYAMSRNSQWLYFYALSAVIGYLCIPSFLYFHAACLLFGVFWIIRRGNRDGKFWWAQLMVIAVAFLTYLPAICFSGIHALAGNPYVTAQITTAQRFYDKGINMFGIYLNFYTSQFTKDHAVIDWVLFFTPIALFTFYKNRLAVWGGLFYLGMWLSCILLAWLMKIYPIDRTMDGQISISLGLTICFFYLLLQKLAVLLKTEVVGHIMLVAGLVALGVWFGIGNEANVKAGLYNNDINIKYDLLKHEGIDFIPRGSTIGFSNECFYWYYLCNLRGDKVSQCPAGNEEYIVRFGLDPFPAADPGKYILVKTVYKQGVIAVGYDIYKRK